MADRPSPPRLLAELLRRLLADDAHEAIAGDLEEEYRALCRRRGVGPARLWYARHAAASILARLRDRLSRRPRREAILFSPSASIPGPEASPMTDLRLDVRQALRMFRQQPALTATIVATLALGIGANAAIFSVLDAALLQPLPFREPERLVSFAETNPVRGWDENHVSVAPANFLDWRDSADTMADITAHSSPIGWALGGDQRPEWVRGALVFHDFFRVFGAEPVLGRSFTEAEVWGGGERVVVIGHGLWLRRFGADPDVVGRTILLDGTERVVVGVAPPGFGYPGRGSELWAPFSWDPANRDATWFRRAHFVRAVGRLAPGATLADARAELDAIAANLATAYPETNAEMGVALARLHDRLLGPVRAPLLILAVAVGLVLLIACANVANLLLARSAARARELAIRSALGAGRRRLVRQLLTESLLLALAGGAAGLLLSVWMTRGLAIVAADTVPRLDGVAVDSRALLFTLAVSVVTGLLFGVLPALRASGLRAAPVLRQGGRGVEGGRGALSMRGALVVVEVALAVLLVTGAGLMARTLSGLYAADLGFDPENVVVLEVEAPSARYPDAPEVLGFFDALQGRIGRHPDVMAVGRVDYLPLDGLGWTSDFVVEGAPWGEVGVEYNRRIIDDGYFEALDIPVLAGRTFGRADAEGSEPVAIVNAAVARSFFPGEDPVGRRIALSDEPDEAGEFDWRRIVGVVGASKQAGVRASEVMEIFLPSRQFPRRAMSVVVRHEPGADVQGAVGAALSEVDPEMPVKALYPYASVVSGVVGNERVLAWLLGGFAVLALGLAAIGLYGVMAHAVADRTSEIGIRMALGARAGQVVGMVLRAGLALVAVGLAAGIAGALLLNRLLSGLLYGVGPADLPTYAAMATVLLATGALASWIPARRATRIDPLEALRRE